MRPDEKHDRAARAGPARARMYLKAHLGWLRGFPVGRGPGWVEWACWPAGGLAHRTVRLDRDALRRAEFAATKLAHRFGRALPQVVEDADRWPDRVAHLLDLFKSAVHHDHPLPTGLPGATGSPVADAFSWLLHLAPAEAAEAAGWAREYAADLGGLLAACGPRRGGVVAVTLWGLARDDGPGRVAKLLRYLGDPDSHTTPVDGVGAYLEDWADGLSRGREPWTEWAPEPPAATLAPELLTFLDWLTGQPAKPRRESLDLLDLFLDETLTRPWQEFWPRVGPLVSEAKRLSTLPEAEARAVHVARLKAAVPPLPRVHLDWLLEVVRRYAAPGRDGLRRQVLRPLPLLPLTNPSGAVRAAFAAAWLDLAGLSRPADAAAHARQFHAHLGHAAGAALAPWDGMVEDWDGRSWCVRLPGYDLWGGAAAARKLGPVYFAALRALGGAPPTDRDHSNLAGLVRVTADAAEAVAGLRAVADAGLRDEYLSAELLGCASRLARLGAPHAGCLTDLRRFTERDAERGVFPSLTAAAEVLAAAGHGPTAGRLAAHKEYARLEALGRVVLLLRRLGDAAAPPPDPPPAAPPPDWADGYPSALRPALDRLAALTPAAVGLAAGVLGKEYRPAAAVERELAAVEALLRDRPADVRLARRRENLAARLATAPRVSAARLGRLRVKLELAADRALTAGWVRRADDRLRSVVGRLLGVADVPGWLLESRPLGLLLAVLDLPERFRGLAVRLFRVRCGPPPWDLRGDPANVRFVDGLRAAGIDPGPWLCPGPAEWVAVKGGRPVRVGFEDDPLEVLRMGEHFATCLSPGACNFFGAVANAADVNKRVVYARGAGGRVVGRCLLALTDAGRVLTFNPYCHDPHLDFGAVVAGLADRLAAAMGTHVTRGGTVPPLVAPDWYDDGPRDLCGRFGFLDAGSAFRKALPTLAPGELVPALRAAFAPHPLDAAALTLVFGHGLFDGRPELVLPLLPLIEASPRLPWDAWWAAARLARRAGEVGFAARVLNRRAVPVLVRELRRRGGCGYADVLSVLAEVDPSAALRVLRTTRPRGVRDDEDETEPWRRAALAAAHERLGRPGLAARLREPAKPLE